MECFEEQRLLTEDIAYNLKIIFKFTKRRFPKIKIFKLMKGLDKKTGTQIKKLYQKITKKEQDLIEIKFLNLLFDNILDKIENEYINSLYFIDDLNPEYSFYCKDLMNHPKNSKCQFFQDTKGYYFSPLNLGGLSVYPKSLFDLFRRYIEDFKNFKNNIEKFKEDFK